MVEFSRQLPVAIDIAVPVDAAGETGAFEGVDEVGHLVDRLELRVLVVGHEVRERPGAIDLGQRFEAKGDRVGLQAGVVGE